MNEMFDETQNKIIQATMNLIMNKGYGATTTKDIAKQAGINECTIFRKFKGKKDIVLSAMTLPKWNPKLKETDFSYKGNLEEDLISFSEVYLSKVTPHMVKVSIGLRSPELYEETAEGIMEIPDTFKRVMIGYFKDMKSRGIIESTDYEGMALQFLAMNFGYVFFKASFGDKLSGIEQEQYVRNSVHRFICGIQ